MYDDDDDDIDDSELDYGREMAARELVRERDDELNWMEYRDNMIRIATTLVTDLAPHKKELDDSTTNVLAQATWLLDVELKEYNDAKARRQTRNSESI